MAHQTILRDVDSRRSLFFGEVLRLVVVFVVVFGDEINLHAYSCLQ